jgi:hypothetical protein
MGVITEIDLRIFKIKDIEEIVRIYQILGYWPDRFERNILKKLYNV